MRIIFLPGSGEVGANRMGPHAELAGDKTVVPESHAVLCDSPIENFPIDDG